jgi:hypothetical protein
VSITVLADDPSDGLIQHYKLMTLVRMSNYQEALKLIGQLPNDTSGSGSGMWTLAQPDVVMQKIYCLYKLNDLDLAFEAIQNEKSKWKGKEMEDVGLLYLEAQVVSGWVVR